MNYAEVGRFDESIDALEKCLDQHEERLVWINHDPRFGALKNDEITLHSLAGTLNLVFPTAIELEYWQNIIFVDLRRSTLSTRMLGGKTPTDRAVLVEAFLTLLKPDCYPTRSFTRTLRIISSIRSLLEY